MGNKETLINQEKLVMEFRSLNFREPYLPFLDRENVGFIEAALRIDSNYRKVMDPSYDGLDGCYYWIRKLNALDPKTKMIECQGILLRIIWTIKAENSTHLNSGETERNELTRRLVAEYDTLSDFIHDLKYPKLNDYKIIKLLSTSTDPSFEKKIVKTRDAEKDYDPKISNFSFATKFCHNMAMILFEGKKEQDNYSIYDRVINSALGLYNHEYANIDFNGDYRGYLKAIDAIRKNEISRNGFDHLIWYYFKGQKIETGEFDIVDGTLWKYHGHQKKVKIPSNVRRIAKYAFLESKELESVEFPILLNELEDDAFMHCENLKKVYIPAELTTIEGNPFTRCPSLEKIEVEEGHAIYESPKGSNVIIEKKSKKVLVGCKNSIIPEGVKIIGSSAFCGCKTLKEFKLPESVVCIEPDAFLGIPQEEIRIPSSVKELQTSAFYHCPNLKRVYIPASLTNIVGNPFQGNSKIESIVVDQDNPLYDSRDNCNAIIRKSDDCLIVGCATTKFPSSIQSIGPRAFFRNESLKEVVIPSNIKVIGDDAFGLCSNVTKLTLEEGIESIQAEAIPFEKIEVITLPKSLKRLDCTAFGCYNIDYKEIHYAGSAKEWERVNVIGNREFEEKLVFDEK